MLLLLPLRVLRDPCCLLLNLLTLPVESATATINIWTSCNLKATALLPCPSSAMSSASQLPRLQCHRPCLHTSAASLQVTDLPCPGPPDDRLHGCWLNQATTAQPAGSMQALGEPAHNAYTKRCFVYAFRTQKISNHQHSCESAYERMRATRLRKPMAAGTHTKAAAAARRCAKAARRCASSSRWLSRTWLAVCTASTGRGRLSSRLSATEACRHRGLSASESNRCPAIQQTCCRGSHSVSLSLLTVGKRIGWDPRCWVWRMLSAADMLRNGMGTKCHLAACRSIGCRVSLGRDRSMLCAHQLQAPDACKSCHETLWCWGRC